MSTSALAVSIPLSVLFYMLSSQSLRVWITYHHNHQYRIFYASKAKHKPCLRNIYYTSSTSICTRFSPFSLVISYPTLCFNVSLVWTNSCDERFLWASYVSKICQLLCVALRSVSLTWLNALSRSTIERSIVIILNVLPFSGTTTKDS